MREVDKRFTWKVEPGQEIENTETAKRLFGSFNAPHDYNVDEIVKKLKTGWFYLVEFLAEKCEWIAIRSLFGNITDYKNLLVIDLIEWDAIDCL